MNKQDQIKVATQDAWEVAGKMDELMARINYVRNYNNNVKLLKKIGNAVQASALYGAKQESFTHLESNEVAYLFSNITVRLNLLKGLRINDMTLAEISVDDLIAHNATIDTEDLNVYTKKLAEVIKASFSGKRKSKNVLLDVESYVDNGTTKLSSMRNIENLGTILRVYNVAGFDHLPFAKEDSFFPAFESLPLLEKTVVDQYGLNADMVLAVCNVQEYRDVRSACLARASQLSEAAPEDATQEIFDAINEDLYSNIVHAILHFEGVHTFEFNNVVSDLEIYFNEISIPEMNVETKSEPTETETNVSLTERTEGSEEPTPEEREVALEYVRQAQAQLEAAETCESESLPEGEGWNLSGDLIETDNVDGYLLCYRMAVRRDTKFKYTSDTKRVYVMDDQYKLWKAAQKKAQQQRAQEAMMW